jgi:hypothetical protein
MLREVELDVDAGAPCGWRRLLDSSMEVTASSMKSTTSDSMISGDAPS